VRGFSQLLDLREITVQRLHIGLEGYLLKGLHVVGIEYQPPLVFRAVTEVIGCRSHRGGTLGRHRIRKFHIVVPDDPIASEA